MNHWQADQIKMGRVEIDRPGIIQAFMQPVKFKNQVRIGQKRHDLKFVPQEKKNLVGGNQWVIEEQRPGIAKPLIAAKREQKALAKGLAMEARLATSTAKGKARAAQVDRVAATAKLEADSQQIEKEVATAEAAKANGIAGYGNFYGAYGSYGY
jgi:hypothetical protein